MCKGRIPGPSFFKGGHCMQAMAPHNHSAQSPQLLKEIPYKHRRDHPQIRADL
jgi:hypothetical protein